MEKKLVRPQYSVSQPNQKTYSQYGQHFQQSGFKPTNQRSTVHPNYRYDRCNNYVQRKAQTSADEKANPSTMTSESNSGGPWKGKNQANNANHLLNFSYSPLPSQECPNKRGKPGYSNWKSKSTRQLLTKEQFLQANCQFFVRESVKDEYMQNLSDPDKMVDWDKIEQVVLSDDQLAVCPICLDIPVAAKITKCAHVYCWPCILHYLSLSDRAWARCPICYDAVEEKDFKSVKMLAAKRYDVGDEVTFHLMKRERDSMYVRPCADWKCDGSGKLFTVNDSDEDNKFSKLLAVQIEDIISMLEEEKRQLVALLNHSETESLEASFIQSALNSVNQRMEQLPVPLADMSMKSIESEKPVELIPQVFYKSDAQLNAVSYLDAFDDTSSSTVGGENETRRPISELSTDFIHCETKQEPAPTRVRNMSTASSDSGETELMASHLVLPPTGTQLGPTSGSKRTEVYYFYQAADGQHVYLHSINTRILAAQYGSLEVAPPTLKATIVETETNNMTPELRKRLKYLSHLPVYSQFTVCEVMLRPPIVSSAVLAHFTEELAQRKRTRNRRTRAENRQLSKAQAEERRKMGKFPDMMYSLESERHFPKAPLASQPSEEIVSTAPVLVPVITSETPASVGCNLPLSENPAPISFAQAMRASAPTNSGASWPKVQSKQAFKSPTHQNPGGDTDESSTPAFKDSFSLDFAKVFDKMSVANNSAQEESSDKKRKKQKNKKQLQVLFSTSSQRAQP